MEQTCSPSSNCRSIFMPACIGAYFFAMAAQNLAQGFDGLWRKAMKSLQEINFDPRGSGSQSSA